MYRIEEVVGRMSRRPARDVRYRAVPRPARAVAAEAAARRARQSGA